MAALGSWEKSRIHQFLAAIGTYVRSVTAGTGTTVDNTDPQNPIVSAKISTDMGNAIVLGADDGLFATAGGGGSTPTGTGFTHITAGVQDGAAKLVDLTAATDVAPNQGTTTTVLHGNAAGQASFGPIILSTDVSGTLAIANGGTGQTTATAAFNALAPASPTKGDILVFNGTDWVKHTHGSNGQIMQFDSAQSDGIANITSPLVPYLSLASELLADTPVALWKLDETSGTTLADSSGNGLDLTIVNSGMQLAQSYLVPSLPTTRFLYTGTATGSYAWRSGSIITTPINTSWTVHCILLMFTPGTTIIPFAIQTTNNGAAATNIQLQQRFTLGSTVGSLWQQGSNSNVTTLSSGYALQPQAAQLISWVTVKNAASKLLRTYINGKLIRISTSYANEPTGGSSCDTYLGNSTNGNLPSDSLMGYCAVYNSVISDTRIAAWAQAAGTFR